MFFFASSLSEVHSKSIIDRERRDWLVIPDAAAAYIYEAVNKVSPRAGQFLLDVSQTTVVSGIRYGKHFCASVAIAIGGKGEGEVGKRTD